MQDNSSRYKKVGSIQQTLDEFPFFKRKEHV